MHYNDVDMFRWGFINSAKTTSFEKRLTLILHCLLCL